MILGERDPALSASIGKAMQARGVRQLQHCTEAENLFSTLDNEIVDVLIYDYDLLGNDFADVMQRIRRKGRGKNPFVIIVAMVSNAEPETVSRLIGAGVDDLVRKPFSIDRLFESVGTLSHERKPFFVSYNYVGPTRRTGHRALEPASQIIHVPNTARSRAIEGISDEELTKMVDRAIKGLDEKQLESCGIEIDMLATRVSQNLGSEVTQEDLQDVRGSLFRIEAVADDLRKRSKGTPFERISELATMVIAMTQRILRAQNPASSIEVQLMVKLAAAIKRALSVERHSVDVMREITSMITNFTKSH
ncbi:MAG TPA: response regulator [Magnetospirillaceae bacterium]